MSEGSGDCRSCGMEETRSGCAAFPAIRTCDGFRTPRRGETARSRGDLRGLAAPRTQAAVDLSAITAALAAAEAATGKGEGTGQAAPGSVGDDRKRLARANRRKSALPLKQKRLLTDLLGKAAGLRRNLRHGRGIADAVGPGRGSGTRRAGRGTPTRAAARADPIEATRAPKAAASGTHEPTCGRNRE